MVRKPVRKSWVLLFCIPMTPRWSDRHSSILSLLLLFSETCQCWDHLILVFPIIVLILCQVNQRLLNLIIRNLWCLRHLISLLLYCLHFLTCLWHCNLLHLLFLLFRLWFGWYRSHLTWDFDRISNHRPYGLHPCRAFIPLTADLRSVDGDIAHHSLKLSLSPLIPRQTEELVRLGRLGPAFTNFSELGRPWKWGACLGVWGWLHCVESQVPSIVSL